MAVEEGWSFSLPGPPESVCYSPSTNSLIACGKEGKISCYDLISGQQLCEAESSSARTRCTFNVATGKLVIVNDKCIGARKDFNGIYLLDSILQPPQDDPNASVILELPLNQVPDLYNELQTLKGKKNISITVKENKANDAKREKWATCCIRGTHKTLMKDFVQPQYDYRSTSLLTMKPIICQLRLRLMLLGQQPNAFSKYECGGDNAGSFNKQSGHMYCEAVRRYSFKNWPHKNYTWAVPDAMAAAGFFLAGSEQHHYGSYSMVDRTLCFCCNVSLHRWEPTDEPWSEHERHSSKCAFIRGEHTENVSISCTEATHPAHRYIPSDVNAEALCVSSTAEGVGLVAVGNSDGQIVIVDLTKHLMLWETWSFCIDENRIAHGLTLPSQQFDPGKQKIDPQKQRPVQKVNKEELEGKQGENQNGEKQVEKDEKYKTEEGQKKQKEGPPNTEDEMSQQEGDHKAVKERADKAPPSSTSQQNLPISSCKLHCLGIVQLPKQEKPQDTGNKTDVDSSNVDPSLLVGVSFCRSSGTHDAAIIVYDIHTSPSCKSVTAVTKKSKSKYYTTIGIPVEPVSDALLDMDDVMPSSMSITVDIDTPSWELVPPLPPEPPLMSSAIPHPPPLPPVKNNNLASKTEKGSQLQIFMVSDYIDDLPNDAHPVVSVIRPCGHGRVAVALEYGPDHGGCIILFNLEHCTGKTILGKSVMYDFKTSDLQVTDMCVMENLETERTSSSHFLGTINKHGSFVVYSMDMNVVVTKNFDDDPLVSCFPCNNVGLFGVVSRSGVVKTVKIVDGRPVAEVNVLAASIADSSIVGESAIPVSPHKVAFSEVLLTDYLQSCYEAIQFASAGLGYVAHAPPGWESISMEQLHKRSPQHVCHKGQTKGNNEIPPLAWQYNLSTGEISHGDDSHHFDLCFTLKKHFGHLDVTFNLYHPDAVSQDAAVSLVLHRPQGATDDSSQHHNVICGPVRLQNFVDVVGNTACIKFTHPELMKEQKCICTLVIENLNSSASETSLKKTAPVDSDIALHPFPRNMGRSKAFRRSLIRKGQIPYRAQSEKPKAAEEKKLAIMIKPYPFAKVLTESDLELHQLLINDVVCHENLALVVTRYQVAKSELENLSPCLQKLIERLEESKDTPCISQKMCYQAFDMLCWIAGVLLYDKVRFSVFLKSVGGLLSSLLYSCFLDDGTPLSLPLKLLRFLHLCGRSELIDPEAHGLFMDQLLKATLAVLPLVFTMSYKGTLQLFFHIMSSHVGPYRQQEILVACRENLSSLAIQLQPGTELITQLLRAEFDLPVIRRRSLLAHPPPVSLPLGLDTMTAESRYYTNERHSDDTELQLLINSSDSVLVKQTSEASMNNSNTNVWPFPSKSLQYSDAHGTSGYVKDSRSDKGLRNPFFARRFSTTLLETLTLSFTFKSFSHSSMSVVDKSLPPKKEALDLESLLVSHKNGVTVGYNILPPDASKDSDYVVKDVENDDYSKDMTIARTLFSLFDLPCLMRSKQILIENIESGVGYSVVLDLERTTELTNVCLNTSHHRIGSVIVDVWGENETEESAVRLVQTTDVKSKSITVGSLLPSPICRYVKITFVIALGANRECIQFPIGLLFGRPLCAIERPLPCQLIQEIQHRLKCKCYMVQSSLAPMVSLYLDLYHVKTSHQQVLKSLGLSIRELYEACRNAEIQLDRFKRVVIERQGKDSKIALPCVIDLAKKAMSIEDIETNRYEIIAQYLVTVAVIILGQKSTLSLMDTTDDEVSSPVENMPLILDPRLPKWCLKFTHEECRTLFYTLCVHGVAEEQVRVCVFLLQSCGAEQWWSSFITSTFLDLFRSNPAQVFSKEKVFLIISTMIQKTLSPEMLSCLMEAAGKLLNPLEGDGSDEGSLDMEQIEWLLFLFSHMLSSVGATGITQNGIILPGAASNQVSNTNYAHKLNEIENQIKEKQNRIEQLGSKAFSSQSGNGDKTFLIKKVQEIKEQTERERVALSEDANKIRKHLDEKSRQDGDSKTIVPLTMLSMVADDVKQQLAGGIMSLIVSYINGNVSIDAVLGACSTLSLLVDSCSTSLQLSCLITSVQFCQLLSFCISWQSARAGNSDPQQGKLQWMCRSVVSLISQIVQNEYISYLKHTVVTVADTTDFTMHKITVKDKASVTNSEDETDSSKTVGSSIPVVGTSSVKSTSDSSETVPQKLSTRLATTSVYSSAIDFRLMNSFNLLAEKDYQHITNAEFEHIITAIRHSGIAHHQKFQFESTPDLTASSSTDKFDIPASRQTASMLTDALNDLLSQARNPLSAITLVDVLEFWNSLITVEPSKLPKPCSNNDATDGKSSSLNDTTVLFFSLELVDSLLNYIVHATIPILLQTWQLIFSFLSNMLRMNKCDSKGIDNLLNSVLLGKVLVKFFTQKWSTNPLVEAREESGCLLEESFSSFFTEVLSIICTNQELSVVCGLQLLMDVLCDSLSVLFQCSGSTFTMMLFAERFSSEVSLTKTLSSLDEKPAQKLLHSFSKLFLCSVKFVKSYLKYSQRDQFELRGTENRVQRHHYMREETTTWIKCLSDGHFAGKLSSYLLQSMRQLSSETNITEKALNALLLFTSQQAASSNMEENHESTLSYTVSEFPFLEILFSNEELLYNVLTTLNSNISSQRTLLSKPKATKILPTAPSSDGFVLHIFQNFVQSIVSNCTNMSCFLKPSLRCLKDSLSLHSQGYGLSTLIAGILAKIFDAPSSSGNEQLVQFLKLGGADLVFQGLIRSCQFNRKVGKSIFSSTMAQVTKSDPLQPTSKDGNLINYASLAAVKLLSSSATQSMNTRLQGLVGGSQTYSSSRSAVIVTTDNMFVNGWLNIVLKLPYPILLHTVQIFHPSAGSYSNSSPSMMALGILHQSNNSPPLPVVSPIITGGIHCQELKLGQPKPAQEIVIYLRRPTNDGQLSLSQISVLGTDLLNDTFPESKKTVEEHPSTGWLNLLCDWVLSSCGEEIITLLLAQAKAQTSALVDASLKFLQESTNLGLCNKMEQFLLFLSDKLEEFRTALLRQLMGISSGYLQGIPPTSNPTIQLLYKLCANSPNNMLFSAVGWLSQPLVVSRLSVTHVRAIASAVWLHRGEENLESLLSQDVFSSLLEYAISLEVTISIKSALCSLLCAICATIPSYFATFVKSTRQLYNSPDELDAKLLYCTGMLCNNNGCLPMLWDSGAVMAVCERLKEIFVDLSNIHSKTTSEGIDETAVNSSLVVACRLLAFLTQLVSNHLEAKSLLLETDKMCDFWKPMMEYLVCHHKAFSQAKNVFFLQVVTKFFKECMCLHMASKIAFVKILIDLMLCNGTGDPAITPLLYNLLVIFIFNMDYVPVILNIKNIPPDLMLPSHLVRAYDSQQFHPSHNISTSSFIIHCPLYSSTLEHLQEYCLFNASSSGSFASPSKQESHQSKKSPDQSTIHDDMYYWYNENEEFYAGPGNYVPPSLKHKLRSKTLADKPEKSTSSLPAYKMLFGDDGETFQVNVKLLTLFGHCRPTGHLPCVVNCSIVEAKSVVGDTGLAEPDLKKTAAADLVDSLSIFIEEGGLQLVSRCLPLLYKHFWPKEEIYQHPDKTAPERIHENPERKFLRPHVLSSLPTSIPFHSLFMLGLCLRMRYFSLALSGRTITFMMLRALLGIESGINQDLTFEPYNQFQCILANNPVGTDIGNTLRAEAFTIGVVHHLLHCLSIAGHHASRCREKDTTVSSSSAFKISSSGGDVSQPSSVAVEGKQYWAKGTGFGTGSFNSKWNMKETVTKQQQEEALVTILFEVLGKYFKVLGSTTDVDCFSSGLFEVCANSCLLPALASYLHNDSVLDMSKHIMLYMSVMRLLQGISSNVVLRPLLLINYVAPEATSSGQAVTKLLAQLKETVTKYCKTVKIGDRNKTKSSSDTELSSENQTGPPLPPRDDQKVKEKGSLNELIASIKVTCELVAHMAQELKHQESEEGKDGEISTQPTQTLDELYMETMKPLQFDTYCIVAEDENGQNVLHVPYHYGDRLVTSTSAQISATKARRLAQEIATLSTSLPLSPSSSVFVRCDDEQLDVMKVLITGPDDTPYANGCFLCDVFFPVEYPNRPMLVNLATTGNNTVRFNPNLYADGKVCLSILNTWQGRPEEKWNAQTSSFLQVLVSIQSLILVPEPYFNEPGYEQYRGSAYGNKRCLVYNGELYCNTMKWAIIEQIRNPDPCFKEVIYRHYHIRRDEVLRQCRKWQKELESAVEKYHDDSAILKQIKSQLNKISQLLPTLQHVLYSIDLREFDKVDKKKEDKNSEENA